MRKREGRVARHARHLQGVPHGHRGHACAAGRVLAGEGGGVRRRGRPFRFRQVHVPEHRRVAGDLRRRRVSAGWAGCIHPQRQRPLGAAQPEDRLHLPELQPDSGPQRLRQRGRAAALPRLQGGGTQAAHRGRAGNRGLGRAHEASAGSFPAASSSASPSPARWPANRVFCWRTNLPAISIPPPPAA